MELKIDVYEVKPSDKKLIGFTCYESIGVGFINPRPLRGFVREANPGRLIMYGRERI